MHLKIFYPGGVSYGVLPDDASNEEIYNALYLAATEEQGNGKRTNIAERRVNLGREDSK